MLDFDLARIYGYGTSAFNQQIKRNLDRFSQDFSFQLTKQEFESILLDHFVYQVAEKDGIQKVAV